MLPCSKPNFAAHYGHQPEVSGFLTGLRKTLPTAKRFSPILQRKDEAQSEIVPAKAAQGRAKLFTVDSRGSCPRKCPICSIHPP
jgi:hypothetical protein